ncbi:MAG: NAD-dependent protein deacylase [Bradymonadaceae bacterium]|nr:NAD-dependent protein deacylase [Lujinxingiaceae bacterium]
MNLHAVRKASAYLIGSPTVLVCVGSGLSAESGVPTFRGPDGMFTDPRIANFTQVDTFEREPEAMLTWYQERRTQLNSVRPNTGHAALARMTNTGNYTIATQNVDNLMEAACKAEGIEAAIHHLHGLLSQVRCHECGKHFDDLSFDLSRCPRCEACGGRLRPGVVWFGESLPEPTLEMCMQAARDADVCLMLGTSGLVYPAAALPEMARSHGAKLIEINTELTAHSDLCEVIVRGSTATVLPVLERVIRDAAH